MQRNICVKKHDGRKLKETSFNRGKLQKKHCKEFEKIRQLQSDLDDDQKEKFFCVYYDSGYYWGKALNMFSQDKESPVEKVEFKFFHPALDGFWDWPSKLDQQFVSAKFIFYGPCMPEPPVPKGFKLKLKTRKRRKHYIKCIETAFDRKPITLFPHIES